MRHPKWGWCHSTLRTPHGQRWCSLGEAYVLKWTATGWWWRHYIFWWQPYLPTKKFFNSTMCILSRVSNQNHVIPFVLQGLLCWFVDIEYVIESNHTYRHMLGVFLLQKVLVPIKSMSYLLQIQFMRWKIGIQSIYLLLVTL